MRLDTVVWMKFESKGKPEETVAVNGTVLEGLRSLLDWISRVPMGHCMRLTIARSEAELEKLTRSLGQPRIADKEQMMAEFAAELDSLLGSPSGSDAQGESV